MRDPPIQGRDVDIINTELVFFKILKLFQKMRIKYRVLLKGNNKKNAIWFECAQRLKAHLEALKPARTFRTASEEEEEYLHSLHLLTSKSILYAANITEDELPTEGVGNPHLAKLRDIAQAEGAKVIAISAKIEEELSSLSEEDAQLYMEDLKIAESGLSRLIKAGYDLLNLSTYFYSWCTGNSCMDNTKTM